MSHDDHDGGYAGPEDYRDMPKASGQVFKVYDKKTRVGLTYQIKLEDDDKYYGTFKDKPDCNSGDFVEFNYSTNAGGWHNVDMDTLTVEAGETATSDGATDAPSPAAAAARASVDGRQASIIWQSARNAAIELSKAAIEAEVLDLGTGKKVAKFEALQIWINSQTVDYAADATKAAQGLDPFAE